LIGIVPDTNVIVSGLLWSGAPRRLLAAGFDAKVGLISSGPILDELLEVLGRPKLADRLNRFNTDPLSLTFDFMAQCRIVSPTRIAPTAPDPDDDMVIATAIAANADLIVTGDKPLLSVSGLGTIRIVGVADALRLIGIN
jgi:putative PIN family toxin of toxin-antitoxin system